MPRIIGTIRNVERDFEWRIENFTSFGGKKNSYYQSPSFSFANVSWYLRIYPNGHKKNGTIGYIDLYLYRESSGPPARQDYSLILKTLDEEIYEETDCSYVFVDTKYGIGKAKFLKRSEFLDKKSELNLPDVLIGICRMTQVENTYEAGENSTVICSNCKKNLDVTNTPPHETKVLDEAMQCPVCCNIIKLKDWTNHKCQKYGIEALEKLSNDLKEMMQSGNNRDMIVKVKGKEFRLHRDILVARNPYFHCMFENDMKEKNTGVVSIEDCEPDIFRTFVQFLYTGKVDKLTSENVCQLYEITDKYQEGQLKKDCLDFMMTTISEDSFCDYIALSLKYDERKLFEKTVEFLLSKPKDIVRSEKWQNFAKEFPTQANELVIKTLDHLVK